MSRWSSAILNRAMKPRSPVFRCACRCSTFTPSELAAAPSHASTPEEPCVSGPSRPGQIPDRFVTGEALQPTVSDANLLLGRLRPDGFLGGEFKLDLDRTRAIVGEWLKGRGSRLTLEQFAEGVVRVVNANMERALRVVSIERGHDPRQFSLVAFGGAGGLHACELAQSLGMPRVILPAMPGALSAFGIMVQRYPQRLFPNPRMECGAGKPLERGYASSLPLCRRKHNATSVKKAGQEKFPSTARQTCATKGRVLSSMFRSRLRSFKTFTPNIRDDMDTVTKIATSRSLR